MMIKKVPKRTVLFNSRELKDFYHLLISKEIYKGSYTAEFEISTIDSDESADYALYLDNLQVIHYGNAFGLLGTSSIPKGSPRDLFTMLVYGTRISFMIGLLTAVFSVLIGLFVGLVSGYMGGVVDEGLMRFADFLLVVLRFAAFLFAVFLLAVFLFAVLRLAVFLFAVFLLVVLRVAFLAMIITSFMDLERRNWFLKV